MGVSKRHFVLVTRLFVTFKLSTQPKSGFSGRTNCEDQIPRRHTTVAWSRIRRCPCNQDDCELWDGNSREDPDRQVVTHHHTNLEMPPSAAWVLAPAFIVPAAKTTDLTSEIKHRFTWTQIQYLQNFTLKFNRLNWPILASLRGRRILPYGPCEAGQWQASDGQSCLAESISLEGWATGRTNFLILKVERSPFHAYP